MRRFFHFCCVAFGLIMLSACSRELILVDGNPPYSTFNISDIKIGNYVNRLYIDIIGREPLDGELIDQVDRLKAGGLERATRDSIIYELMTDTTYRENEFSYKAAYVQNLYNLAKVRCLEGVGDYELDLFITVLKNSLYKDSLEGKWDEYYKKKNEIRRNEAALGSRQALYNGWIQYHQVFAFMIDNGVYDIINMNSFNFIRASFDQLLWRLPTAQEFDRSFTMVQDNETSNLFGVLGSDKNDYVRILTESNEMYEGMVIWSYRILLSREPSAGEVVTLLPTYRSTKDINWLLAQILVTDEYANFR